MTPWCTAPLLTSCSCQQLIYGGQACHQKTENTVTTSSCSTHSARRDLHYAFDTPDLVIADRASSSSASSVVFTVLATARGCTVGIIPCSDPITQTCCVGQLHRTGSRLTSGPRCESDLWTIHFSSIGAVTTSPHLLSTAPPSQPLRRRWMRHSHCAAAPSCCLPSESMPSPLHGHTVRPTRANNLQFLDCSLTFLDVHRLCCRRRRRQPIIAIRLCSPSAP